MIESVMIDLCDAQRSPVDSGDNSVVGIVFAKPVWALLIVAPEQRCGECVPDANRDTIGLQCHH